MSDAANEWLVFAREDLRVAHILLREEIYTHVCFHSQQCVEKSLKAVLAHAGHAPPRIHSITDLLKLMPAALAATLPGKMIQLDMLYMPTRYPDTLPGTLPDGLPSEQQAKETLGWAQEVLEKVEQFTHS
ncbi:MAG: HEPN domain-containing protein [Chloroflexota bacterium]|nr:HEPN domain-containing protein [Chloroflexota bacterium]